MWALACILGAGLAAGPSAGHVAFIHGPPGEDQRLCLYDLATQEVQRLGPGENDAGPTWSPEGEWLAFETTRDGARVIALYQPERRELRYLPHQSPHNADPRWAPLGQRLAYTVGASLDEQRLAVHDVESGAETFWGGDTRGLAQPEWLAGRSLEVFLAAGRDLAWEGNSARQDISITPASGPDEQDVLTVVLREAEDAGALLAIGVRPGASQLTTHIFLVTPGASLPLPLEVMPSQDEYEEWGVAAHAKARFLAFESNDGGDREIYVLSFLKGAYNVSNHFRADWNPEWDPSGQWLVFESFRNGTRGIYRAYPDTIRLTELAADAAHNNWAPAHSSNGEHAVFVSDRDGAPRLYRMRADGSEQEPLEGAPAHAFEPAWRPE